MAQQEPSRGESVTENMQDYIEGRIEDSTNMPQRARQAEQLEHAEADLQRAQAGELDRATGTSPQMAPGAEDALEEHLAATENVRGGAQSDVANPGAADAGSTAAQREARERMTDRIDDQTGMGNVRS